MTVRWGMLSTAAIGRVVAGAIRGSKQAAFAAVTPRHARKAAPCPPAHAALRRPSAVRCGPVPRPRAPRPAGGLGGSGGRRARRRRGRLLGGATPPRRPPGPPGGGRPPPPPPPARPPFPPPGWTTPAA